MPDSIISQFERQFAAPIETDRQVNSVAERDAIPTNVRWEGMIVYVLSEKISYELRSTNLDNTGWTVYGGTDTEANHYRGNYNVTTGLPAISDGIGEIGDEYRISGAPIPTNKDFGSGNISLQNGDFIMYTGTIYIKKINNNQGVSLTDGQGLTFDTDHYNLGGDITTDTSLDLNGTSTLTISKESSETGLNTSLFVDTTRDDSVATTENTIAGTFRVVDDSTANVVGVTGINAVGRKTGSGNSEYVYGSLLTAEHTGTGDVDFIIGEVGYSKITGSNTVAVDYVRGSYISAVLDNDNATLNALQAEHPNITINGGTVTGDTDVCYLDVDVDIANSANIDVQGNVSYLRAGVDTDLAALTIGGKKRFIWYEGGFESDFGGLINMNVEISDIASAPTDKVLVTKEYADIIYPRLLESNVFTDSQEIQQDLLIGGQVTSRHQPGSTPLINFASFFAKPISATDGYYTTLGLCTSAIDDSTGYSVSAKRISETEAHLYFRHHTSSLPTGVNRMILDDVGNLSVTGKVSGLAPTATNEFVTKGYAESNFLSQTNGTFTPTLIDAGGGATYSIGSQSCSYVKTGRIVNISVNLSTITTSGSPSGILRIQNLPYSCSNIGTGSIFAFTSSSVQFYWVGISVNIGTLGVMFPYQNNLDGTTSYTLSSVTITSGNIQFSATYETDD